MYVSQSVREKRDMKKHAVSESGYKAGQTQTQQKEIEVEVDGMLSAY
jgi:hypothetical protein